MLMKFMTCMSTVQIGWKIIRDGKNGGNSPIVHVHVGATWYHHLTVSEAGANANHTQKVCSVR